MRIGVVAVPGCFDSAFTSILDILRTANAGRALIDPHLPELAVQVLAVESEPVTTGGGLVIPVDEVLDDAEVDVLVVPALGANTPAAIGDALLRDDVRALRSHLIRWRTSSTAEFAAACTGTFVLADAGLLEDRRATTSWWLSDEFSRRFPRVTLDMSQMVVRDRQVTTAGAAFAHIDLAMSLVSRVSPQLVELTAKTLLIDARPSRTVSAALGHHASTDQLVTAFEGWARSNLHRQISVAEGAASIGTNRRTLERRVQVELSTTPNAVIRRLRAERARHLRETTGLSWIQISEAVGYRDQTSLRRAMEKYVP